MSVVYKCDYNEQEDLILGCKGMESMRYVRLSYVVIFALVGVILFNYVELNKQKKQYNELLIELKNNQEQVSILTDALSKIKKDLDESQWQSVLKELSNLSKD